MAALGTSIRCGNCKAFYEDVSEFITHNGGMFTADRKLWMTCPECGYTWAVTGSNRRLPQGQTQKSRERRQQSGK